jgi:cell fate regulator YaaT (PSP1 superfamily)
MPKICGIRFRGNGKVYYFSPGELEINKGDGVIVETAQGVEFGDVIIAIKEVGEDEIVSPLKKVIRIADEQDYSTIEDNRKKEEEAFGICEKKILKHDLEMSLVNVEYSFDNKKIVFFFTADRRVDFRELVKELASTFRTRIELRQIGVRDEAKMKGGLGPCGREVCCATFMADFHPVSIKMAKDQNISLNPTKISGLCGRLMCCLEHEHNVYKEIKPKLKKVGSFVMTPEGPGTVVDNLILLEMCKVRVMFPGEVIELKQYPLDDVKNISKEEADKQYQLVKSKKPRDVLFKNPNETWVDEPNKKTDNNKSRNKKRRRNKKKYRPKNNNGKAAPKNGGDKSERNKKKDA